MERVRIEVKWALIFVGMMLTWMLLERLTGLHGEHIDKHAIFTNFVAIPAIAIYVFALRDKRLNHFDGTMTYRQGLTTGIIITGIIALLTPGMQYLISTVIAPSYFPNMIEFSVAEGKMTRPDAEANFNLNSYMVQATIGVLVMGGITTVIVAAFQRGKGKGETRWPAT